MDLLILFSIGVTTGLSGAMIPGPLFLYTVSEAFKDGQKAGIKIALGHLILEAGFVAIIIVGFRDLLILAPVKSAIAWIGGLSLIIMGGVIFSKVRQLSLAADSPVTFRGGPFIGGAFFSIISPGFLIWWATIGTSVFLQGLMFGVAGIIVVAAGHALADIVWHWFVAFSVERGKTYCDDRTYRIIMACVALGLIILGAGLPISHFLSKLPVRN